MKPSVRDYLTILLSFLCVFVSGYGVGRLLDDEPPASAARGDTAWEEQSLRILVDSLDLSPEDRAMAESEVSAAASEIRATREQTILTYHRHLSELYQRLIDRLGEPHAPRLEKEKRALDAKIKSLEPQS